MRNAPLEAELPSLHGRAFRFRGAGPVVRVYLLMEVGAGERKGPCRLPQPLAESAVGAKEGRQRLPSGGWGMTSLPRGKPKTQFVGFLHVNLYFQLRGENVHPFSHRRSFSMLCCSISPPPPTAHIHTHTHPQPSTSTSSPPTHTHTLSLGSPLCVQTVVLRQSPRPTSGSRRVLWVKSCPLL